MTDKRRQKPGDEAAATVDLADTTRTVFSELSESPSIGVAKARMAALFDLATHDESDECEVLFTIIDELFVLVERWPSDTGAWLEIAREAAFARTARFRSALYDERGRAKRGG